MLEEVERLNENLHKFFAKAQKLKDVVDLEFYLHKHEPDLGDGFVMRCKVNFITQQAVLMMVNLFKEFNIQYWYIENREDGMFVRCYI